MEMVSLGCTYVMPALPYGPFYPVRKYFENGSCASTNKLDDRIVRNQEKSAAQVLVVKVQLDYWCGPEVRMESTTVLFKKRKSKKKRKLKLNANRVEKMSGSSPLEDG